MQSTGEIMSSAHESLKGRWGKPILLFVIMIAISMATGFIPFASLIITGPLSLGLAIFF